MHFLGEREAAQAEIICFDAILAAQLVA